MSSRPSHIESRVEPLGSAMPSWWIVFTRELAEQWIGGRALSLILIYTILMGIITYVMASNSELSIIPPKEMVYETLKGAIAFGLFIGLIIGADSISGERERATLESLLLTPTSRRQIAVGKYLAAVSPWPVALLITVPYMSVLSQGDEVFGQAVLWGAVFGTLLAPAFTGLGMLISFWCQTNKTSFFVSLCIYFLFLLPTQLPGQAQTGAPGRFLQWVNPMQAPNFFLAKYLVNNRPLEELWSWLITPVLFAVLILILLICYVSPHLRLEAGKASKLRSYWARVVGPAMIVVLMFSQGTSSAMGQERVTENRQVESTDSETAPLRVSVNMDHKELKAGDKIEFKTLVTNASREMSPPLIWAMNIINLNAQGDVVDPEDWSPQRTQYITALPAGQSATHTWRVNAILDGNFMVYMVVIPTPKDKQATSQPIASSGIHLTVARFTKLNPRGVLPYAIGIPFALVVAIALLIRRRRRAIDTGGSE